jgi:hypothetical protein
MASSIDPNDTLKRLQNRYRMVIMNDDTFEEVVTFKLSRLSVYIALSTLFVLLVGVTVALIVFTPLKYYIPGYGSQYQRRDMVQLKMKADSLEQAMIKKDKYLESLKGVFSGENSILFDTTNLSMPVIDTTKD